MRYKVWTVGVAFMALVVFMGTSVLAAGTHQGKVVKAADGKLTMTDMQGNNEHTHEVDSAATISCGGETCGLADVAAGDVVTVTTDAKNGKTVVTKIEAKKSGS